MRKTREGRRSTARHAWRVGLAMAAASAMLGASAPSALAQSLVVTTAPGGCTVGTACVTQPVVEVRTNGGTRDASFTGAVSVVARNNSGGLQGTRTVTAVAGVATFTDLRLTAATVGGEALSFSAGELTATAPITAVFPTIHVASQPTAATSTQPVGTISVEVRDPSRGSAPIAGFTGTITASCPDCSASTFPRTLGGTTSLAASAGRATFSALVLTGPSSADPTTTYSAPTRLVFATTVGGTELTVGTGFIALSQPRIVVTTSPGTRATSGAPFPTQPVVEIRDHAGTRLASGATIAAVQCRGGAVTISGGTSATASNGTASFAGLALSGTGWADLCFQALNHDMAVVGAITVEQPRLAVVTQPAGGIDGQAFTTQPVVEVQDFAGNRIASATPPVTASRASGAGTLGGTATVTAVAGRATFANLAITGTGAHTLAFAAPSHAGATSASFTVASATTPVTLALSPTTTSSSSVAGSATPAAQSVTVTLGGTNGATTAWTAAIVGGASAAPWISLTASSGTGSGTLSFTRSAAALSAQTYTATIRVTAGGLTQDITDTYTVTSAPVPLALAVAPATQTSTAVAGSTTPEAASATVTLSGTGASSQAWSATLAAPASWITLTTASGTGSSTLGYARNPSGLAAGTYTATIRVTAGALTRDVTDTYTITPPAALSLAVAPTMPTASASAGSAATITQSVTVTLSGTNASSTAWTATASGSPALQLTTASGTGSGPLAFQWNPSGLAAGAHTATITVTAGTLTRAVTATLTVQTQATPLGLAVAPDTLRLSAALGATTPATGTFTVTLTGTPAPTTTWRATAPASPAGFAMLATDTLGSGSIAVTWKPSAAGTFYVPITVTAGALTRTAVVALTVTGAPLSLALSAPTADTTYEAGLTVRDSILVTLAGPGADAAQWRAESLDPSLTFDERAPGAATAIASEATTRTGTGSGWIHFSRWPLALEPGARPAAIRVTLTAGLLLPDAEARTRVGTHTLEVLAITPLMAAKQLMGIQTLIPAQTAKLNRVGSKTGTYNVGDVHALIEHARGTAATNSTSTTTGGIR